MFYKRSTININSDVFEIRDILDYNGTIVTYDSTNNKFLNTDTVSELSPSILKFNLYGVRLKNKIFLIADKDQEVMLDNYDFKKISDLIPYKDSLITTDDNDNLVIEIKNFEVQDFLFNINTTTGDNALINNIIVRTKC